MNKVNRVLSLVFLIITFGCKQEAKLPILGEKVLDESTGEFIGYHAPKFQLTNQLEEETSSNHLSDKIQVVDFFFTTCPTICPQMTDHLKLVQDAFEGNEKVHILSYSIDPKHDTPAQLNQYAQKHNINSKQWSLLTGDRETIFELSKDYKVRAFEDEFAGNRELIHDGTFVLVDTKRRIRGYYNGLDKTDTQRLIDDINILLKE